MPPCAGRMPRSLLFSVAPDRADGVLAAFRAAGEACWEIGEVLPEPIIYIAP